MCMHVTARVVSTHALSIFGDHSDVMAVRQPGFVTGRQDTDIFTQRCPWAFQTVNRSRSWRRTSLETVGASPYYSPPVKEVRPARRDDDEHEGRKGKPPVR